MRSTAITNSKPALQKGSGGLSELDNQAHRIIKQRIIVVSFCFSLCARGGIAIFFRSLEEFLLVLGGTLGFPELNHGSNFFFCDKWSMQSMHPRRSGGQIKHVTAAQQSFGSVGVEDSPRIYFCRHPERDSGREIGLNKSGDYIDRRPLGCKHEMDSYGAGHLCQSRN